VYVHTVCVNIEDVYDSLPAYTHTDDVHLLLGCHDGLRAYAVHIDDGRGGHVGGAAVRGGRACFLCVCVCVIVCALRVIFCV